MTQAKKSIRRAYLEQRSALTNKAWQSSSQEIIDKCIQHLPWKHVKRVHIYLPLIKSREVDTHPLISYIFSELPHVEIYVPSLGGPKRLRPDSRLAFNQFGYQEPIGPTVSLDYIDYIFVPLIAFDCFGHRVGYGGGYYDTFLAVQNRQKTIGLAYDFSEFSPKLPREAHDVAIDCIVTEGRIIVRQQ